MRARARGPPLLRCNDGDKREGRARVGKGGRGGEEGRRGVVWRSVAWYGVVWRGVAWRGEGARQSSFSGVSFLLSVLGGPLSQHAYKAVFIASAAAHGPRGPS